MIMRIWRARVDEARGDEYERFAQQESLPMFQAQAGFRGLVFGRSCDNCVVVTLWEDEAAADSLDASTSYLETVARIRAADFSLVDLGVERFNVHAADQVSGLPTNEALSANVPLHPSRRGLDRAAGSPFQP